MVNQLASTAVAITQACTCVKMTKESHWLSRVSSEGLSSEKQESKSEIYLWQANESEAVVGRNAVIQTDDYLST